MWPGDNPKGQQDLIIKTGKGSGPYHAAIVVWIQENGKWVRKVLSWESGGWYIDDFDRYVSGHQDREMEFYAIPGTEGRGSQIHKGVVKEQNQVEKAAGGKKHPKKGLLGNHGDPYDVDNRNCATQARKQLNENGGAIREP